MADISPIFVIGSYRSGTSIFAWCLGQSSNIFNLPETNWIYQYALNVEKLYEQGTCNGKHSHLAQAGFTLDEFYKEMGCCVDNLVMKSANRLDGFSPAGNNVDVSGFRRVRSETDQKARWVDATPENSHYVYGLSKMFPQAKFIHLVRDPEDVVRSLLKFSNAGGRDYSEVDAYKTWYRLAEAAFSGEQALGSNRVLRILYSELIDKPEQTLEKCLGFLGEEYDSNCIEPLQKKINSSKVDSYKSLTSKLQWPSVKEIKRKSKKLYSLLEDSIDDRMAPDQTALDKIKQHHEKASKNV